MRFLQIGLGSMGKRRVRCLKKLGHGNIVGFDFREDRRREAQSKYGIKTISDISAIDFNLIDLIIISTPPDKHNEYIETAIKNRKAAFVEASVIVEGLKELNLIAKKKDVLIAPSCTLKYHPAIRIITEIVKSKEFGKLTNFTYHCGQYLPDWHPHENVKKFYVGKKKTGAAREMVAFELTWITGVAGFAKNVAGFYGKTMDVGANIDDTYCVAMEFNKNAYGVLNVDVVSRYATRSLILNMEHGQILWRWDDFIVKVYDAKKRAWDNRSFQQGKAAAGYNKNITEDMYVNELNAFIMAAAGKKVFPNTLEHDIRILETLKRIEDGDK